MESSRPVQGEISSRTLIRIPFCGLAYKDSGDLAAWIELSLVPASVRQRFRSLLSTSPVFPGNVLNVNAIATLSRRTPEALQRASRTKQGRRSGKSSPVGCPARAQRADPCRRRIPQATAGNRRCPRPCWYVSGSAKLLSLQRLPWSEAERDASGLRCPELRTTFSEALAWSS